MHRHGKLFVNNVKYFVKYIYDCKSVLNLFCFYKPICELNINIKLIDYALNSVFRGYTLTFIDMFIYILISSYRKKYDTLLL